MYQLCELHLIFIVLHFPSFQRALKENSSFQFLASRILHISFCMKAGRLDFLSAHLWSPLDLIKTAIFHWVNYTLYKPYILQIFQPCPEDYTQVRNSWLLLSTFSSRELNKTGSSISTKDHRYQTKERRKKWYLPVGNNISASQGHRRFKRREACSRKQWVREESLVCTRKSET